ncbi:Hypothetical protein PENO1_111330 [Penicillium occitanis (nom. inval.)]|nr:Hypothetical protein PENO1_111330 [Penicillium occitanis (nom. inval.)]PCG88305.1 hypothetical protein PENOC_111600 [Penicillium occitanis (nom. inval.)]
MNGNMIEAKTRHVDWPEVDVDTFARLCEFAYLRDYTPPSPHVTNDRFLDSKKGAKKGKKDRKKKTSAFNWDDPVVEAAPNAEPEMEPAPDEYRDSEPQPERVSDDDKELPYRERSIWTEHLRDAFVESLAVPLPQQDGLVYDFSSPRNNLPWQDFTPVFLGQAQLYVLADKYGIEPLRQLVLFKLYQSLKSFNLYPMRLNGVLELVRYVYANTPPKYNDTLDALRNLVTRYIVSILGQIGDHDLFQDLLQEGGDFVTDFWGILWSVQGPSNM